MVLNKTKKLKKEKRTLAGRRCLLSSAPSSAFLCFGDDEGDGLLFGFFLFYSAARFVSFFPLCSCDSANGWFPCFWYLIDLLCSLRFSFVVFGCRSYEGTLPSLSSVSTRPCLPLGFLFFVWFGSVFSSSFSSSSLCSGL